MLLNRDIYLNVAGLLGPLLAELHADAFPVDVETLPFARRAVYVATNTAGEVIYVGSVARDRSTALRCRITEHLRNRDDATEWNQIWVLPVHDNATVREVRWAEARVGRYLQPTNNHRLPRFPCRGIRQRRPAVSPM